MADSFRSLAVFLNMAGVFLDMAGVFRGMVVFREAEVSQGMVVFQEAEALQDMVAFQEVEASQGMVVFREAEVSQGLDKEPSDQEITNEHIRGGFSSYMLQLSNTPWRICAQILLSLSSINFL